jgi:hypothetical protein
VSVSAVGTCVVVALARASGGEVVLPLEGDCASLAQLSLCSRIEGSSESPLSLVAEI